jgi:hypothetical protein
MTSITTAGIGRRWAYTGITLGGTVSVAANVAHSFVPPAGAPVGWRPQTGAVIGAIVWPVFLFAAIEILARTAWPPGWRWWLLRYAGLLPVAAVAAIVSYRHLSGLLAFYGEDRLVVTIGPAAVDGLMVMATGALLADLSHRATIPAAEPIPEPAAAPADTMVRPPAPAAPIGPVAVPAHLIPTARFAVTNHEVTTGQPITAEQLAVRMSVSAAVAEQLLAQLRDNTTLATPPARVNGTHVLEEVAR